MRLNVSITIYNRRFYFKCVVNYWSIEFDVFLVKFILFCLLDTNQAVIVIIFAHIKRETDNLEFVFVWIMCFDSFHRGCVKQLLRIVLFSVGGAIPQQKYPRCVFVRA